MSGRCCELTSPGHQIAPQLLGGCVMWEWFSRAAGQCDECTGQAAQSDAGCVHGVRDLRERLAFGALAKPDQDPDRDVDGPARRGL